MLDYLNRLDRDLVIFFGSGIGSFVLGKITQPILNLLNPPIQITDKEYAIYPVKNEEDALKKLKGAYSTYSKVDITTQNSLEFNLLGFDEGGGLVQELKETDKKGKTKITKVINHDVTLLRYANTSALKIAFLSGETTQAFYNKMKINNYLSGLPKQ